MKRRIAFVLYLVGTLLSVAPPVAALARFDFSLGGFYEVLMATAFGLASWWIVAGIGYRMGIPPVEFFRFLGSYLGVRDESLILDGEKPAQPIQPADPV